MRGVLLDTLEGFDGERQCFSSVSTGHRRGLPVPRSLDECNNLSPQRLDVDNIQVLYVDARPNATRRRRSQTANRCAFSGVIDGDVIVWLKETHLANFFNHTITSPSDRKSTRLNSSH